MIAWALLEAAVKYVHTYDHVTIIEFCFNSPGFKPVKPLRYQSQFHLLQNMFIVYGCHFVEHLWNKLLGQIQVLLRF